EHCLWDEFLKQAVSRPIFLLFISDRHGRSLWIFFQRNFINSFFHFPYNSSYKPTFGEGSIRLISFRSLNASFGEEKIPAPIPAPSAAPTLPSFSYNSTGTFVVSTKTEEKRSLKNIFAFPTRITEGRMPFSRIMSRP